MKIYMHKSTGKLMITWFCYISVPQDVPGFTSQTSGYSITVGTYEYAGIACENEHGITCVMNESVLKEFEYIGEL